MADEPAAAPADAQDTPTPDAPEAPTQDTPEADQQTAPSTDWEQRYNSLRPEFDRTNQLVAAARGDHGPEAQAEALRQFGIELQQEEEAQQDPYDSEFADPAEQALQKAEALEQLLAERDEQAEVQRFDQLEEEYIAATISELEAQEGLNLSEKEKKLVRNNALANRLQDDRPDLEGAFADLKDIQSAARDRYLKSKKTAALAPIGTAGEDKIDLRDPEARQKKMAEIIAAEEGE
jgi:hypothetical protein